MTNIIKPSNYRVALMILILSLIIATATGILAGKAESWLKITIILAIIFSLFIDIQSWITDNVLIMLLLAVFIGMIPFSILLTSSISQDGHGSLPLLAESKKGFLYVKSVNMVVALTVGLIGYAMRL